MRVLHQQPYLDVLHVTGVHFQQSLVKQNNKLGNEAQANYSEALIQLLPPDLICMYSKYNGK
jgi:hypothetical protein